LGKKYEKGQTKKGKKKRKKKNGRKTIFIPLPVSGSPI
jgi:hypothetical protein